MFHFTDFAITNFIKLVINSPSANSRDTSKSMPESVCIRRRINVTHFITAFFDKAQLSYNSTIQQSNYLQKEWFC